MTSAVAASVLGASGGVVSSSELRDDITVLSCKVLELSGEFHQV